MYAIAAILRILVLYFIYMYMLIGLIGFFASKSITEYQTTFIYEFGYKLSVLAILVHTGVISLIW